MSVTYRAVGWNPEKRRYDLAIAAGCALFLVGFATVSLSRPGATLETTLIRGLGALAFGLLHVILCIGPLCRLDRRFLPLLYNRRHLGVTMALVGMAHAVVAVIQYHGGGAVNPLVSLAMGAPTTRFPSEFPFEWLGVAALGVIGLMAATSHDFWLSVLSPRLWKSLHMGVYVAYGLLILHVALGALQAEPGLIATGSLGLGFGVVVTLHVVAGAREWRQDRGLSAGPDGWVTVCPAGQVPEGRAVGAVVGGERVAVYRHRGRLSAVSGVCRHQNGPLAEGRIVDGCITCPWHGYQYRPEDGTSPPPYDDRIATYRLRIRDGQVEVHERANPPGTPVEPIPVETV